MIVMTDAGADLSPEQLEGLHIERAPLTIVLDGKSYLSGVDLQPEQFYELLASTESLPTTSLPSVGELSTIFRRLMEIDREIVFVTISSGLSGTHQVAVEAAKMVPEALIHVIDSFTLSGAEGWQAQAAARAARAGWDADRIRALCQQIGRATEGIFTLSDLKYLIHGGRISHISGLLASILDIKPVIGVSHEDGKYYQRGRARSFRNALAKLVSVVAEDHAPGTPLRVQPVHSRNPEGSAELREMLERQFPCHWLPSTPIAPVLGAHTGPSMVGLIYAAESALPVLP